MSWLTSSFITAPKKTENTESSIKNDKPLKRWVILLIILPGQILYWGLMIHFLSTGENEALLGITGYVIVANLLSTKSSYSSWWETAEYWSSDLFFKIILFPGKFIGTSFILLYSLLRYNLS